MPEREVASWRAYFAVEGTPTQRVELGIAQLTALFASVNQGKNGKKFKAADFLGPWWKTPRISSPTDIKATLMKIKGAIDAKGLR